MIVAYMRDSYPFDAVLFGSCLSMAAAKKTRQTSGDLVFNEDRTINQSEEWLWEWEKSDPKCYARKSQAAGVKVGALEVNSSRVQEPQGLARVRAPYHYFPQTRSRLVF